MKKNPLPWAKILTKCNVRYFETIQENPPVAERQFLPNAIFYRTGTQPFLVFNFLFKKRTKGTILNKILRNIPRTPVTFFLPGTQRYTLLSWCFLSKKGGFSDKISGNPPLPERHFYKLFFKLFLVSKNHKSWECRQIFRKNTLYQSDNCYKM